MDLRLNMALFLAIYFKSLFVTEFLGHAQEWRVVVVLGWAWRLELSRDLTRLARSRSRSRSRSRHGSLTLSPRDFDNRDPGGCINLLCRDSQAEGQLTTPTLKTRKFASKQKKKGFVGVYFEALAHTNIFFIMSVHTTNLERATSLSESSENSDILNMKDEEGWVDAEPDEEETPFISLLDDEVFLDIHSMLNHCKEKHGFDFLEIRQRLGLDFYGNIKLVNFIRSQVHSGQKISSNISREDFEDDKFLKPVLEDDALLFSLDELPEVMEDIQGTDAGDTGKGKSGDSGQLIARVSELEEELRRIQLQFDNYRATVSETLDDRWNDKSKDGSSAKPEEKRDDDSHYFSSYSYNGKFFPICTWQLAHSSRYP